MGSKQNKRGDKAKAQKKSEPRKHSLGKGTSEAAPEIKATTHKSQPKPKKKNGSALLSRQETCDLIAELSESILEDPTKAFSSGAVDNDMKKKAKKEEEPPSKKPPPSMMRQLLAIASFEEDEYTSQLAILSLLAIFRDLIPSYRIRLPTASEMSVQVSLETKKLWDYERALLTHYQQYLKLLEKVWDKGKSQRSLSTLTVTSMLCMCELLKAAFHFNFRSNLLSMVMRQINNGQCEEVSSACCSAVEHVFANDVQGEVALEATRLLSKAIKDRGFKVKARVLRTFLALPLRVHVDEAQAAKLATAAKKKKKDKELKEIEKELEEASASVDKILLARCQSDTLQAVTLTYFRILKSDNLNTGSHMEELLPAALEGLAKFAHLINIDTVKDLLAVLKDLLKSIDALPLEAALNCVLTAFQTLSGPGKEMQIDQKEYITPLYTQLPRLVTQSSSRKSTDSLLKCLDAALIKRREYSTTRVAAFLKQIFAVAMYAPQSTSIPLLAFGRQLLQRYPATHQLLENEQDAITSGQFCPDVDDPELANPFSTAAWELASLKFHINPAVRQQAEGAATLKMLQMPAEDPDRLRSDLLQNEDELYVKFRGQKKRHPLEARNQDEGKKRRRLRFIHASNRNLEHLSSNSGVSLL
jgi:nucleolar complex protein 3